LFQREKSGRTGSGKLSSRIGGLSIVDSELGPKKVRPEKRKVSEKDDDDDDI